jgi:Protein of unknown function (DUF1186)/SEC-C motif
MKRVRRSRSATQERYPLASIAAYGPDSTLATKLVVSVIERPGQRDPFATQTWTTETGDVRHDPAIAADVASFVQQHDVRQTVSAERLIGCPHEEGVDYPIGRTCPRCPFWAGIDRFTHEPVTRPEPTMTPTEILAALSTDEPEPPFEALDSAEGHRDVLVEPLLRAIDCVLVNPPGASPEESILFTYALYLLAKWREPRAYPYVVRWLSLAGEAAFDIAGDVVTQDGGRILAAVCDGDLEPIKTLVLDRRANEYGRASGVTALALLAVWAEVPRESIITLFMWLAREGLEREPGQVWNSLAADSADIEALPLFPELRRAYEDGLIEPQFIDPSELDEVEAAPRGSVLEETQDRLPPIDDVVEATAWWGRSGDARQSDDSEPYVAAEPYRAPPKVGRNEPCPCGSGRKFKKCCGA